MVPFQQCLILTKHDRMGAMIVAVGIRSLYGLRLKTLRIAVGILYRNPVVSEINFLCIQSFLAMA